MQPLSNVPVQMLQSGNDFQRLGMFQEAAADGSLSGASDEAKLKEVAQRFDTYFARILMKEMRNSVMKSTLFGDGAAGEIYQDMFDEHLAEALGKAGGFGVGEMIIKDLSPSTKRISAEEAIQLYEKQRLETSSIPLAEGKSETSGFPINEEIPAEPISLPDETRQFDLNFVPRHVGADGMKWGEVEK